MTDLAILVSFLIVAGSAAALVAPLRLLDWVSHSFGWGLLALGSALRIGMGLVLFFAGMTAYWPDFVQTAGFLIGLAGLALPFVGLERVRRINPSIPIGIFILTGAGDDPVIEGLKKNLAGGYLSRFMGNPADVAAALQDLGEMGIDRVQLTQLAPGSHSALANHLL